MMLSVLPVWVGFAQGSEELQVLAHVDDYPSVGYNDCWGYIGPDGREYALLGVQNGTSIVDITDAPATNEIAFIPSATSLWKDIKTYRSYAYAVNESGGGLQIIDLSDLPNSATLAGTYSGFTTSHNIYIDTTTAILYAEGSSGNQSVRVISLADPVNPVQLSTFGLECHDIFVRDNVAFVAEGYSGSIGIYDLSNPAAPALIQRHNIPSPGYVHNVWVSDDGNYMITTEETYFKTIKYWDITDFGDITLTSEYLSAPGYFAHNAFLKGDYGYISHYDDGVRVIDVSDPYAIHEVGYYGTFSGSGLGCWGTYPYFQSGKIIGSDVETGLWVLYFEGALGGDLQDPLPPTEPVAYSDYATPTSMHLSWVDPTTLLNGTPIAPGDFVVEVNRDGINVGSAPGGAQEFTDNGLVEGQLYAYTIYTRLLANDSTSRTSSTEWIAGGSPVPGAPTEFSVRGNSTSVMVHWRNTSVNDDGTPINDLAGIHLYQDDIQVAMFPRAPGAAGQLDSAMFTPAVPGYYLWYVTSIDDDVPLNESTPSGVGFTPLTTPFSDDFAAPGTPNPAYWINQDGDVNSRGDNPPSTPYSLNLNGHPDGGDIVDLRPFDLTGLNGSGISLTFSYQPQGNGNAPEIGDSLLVFLRNSLGEWVKIRGYAGTGNVPFQEVTVDIAAENPGAGTFFFSQFQVRFQSYGTSDPSQFYDDWFVDDVALSLPTSVGNDVNEIPERFALDQNYPNPFNPSTTFEFEVPVASHVRLTVYNLLGQAVKTLLDDPVEPGTHRAKWDGRNESGQSVVSGVYFYRMEAGDFVGTRKMVLLK
jgi:choice-of-anchor B domain-containing protein